MTSEQAQSTSLIVDRLLAKEQSKNNIVGITCTVTPTVLTVIAIAVCLAYGYEPWVLALLLVSLLCSFLAFANMLLGKSEAMIESNVEQVKLDSVRRGMGEFEAGYTSIISELKASKIGEYFEDAFDSSRNYDSFFLENLVTGKTGDSPFEACNYRAYLEQDKKEFSRGVYLRFVSTLKPCSKFVVKKRGKSEFDGFSSFFTTNNRFDSRWLLYTSSQKNLSIVANNNFVDVLEKLDRLLLEHSVNYYSLEFSPSGNVVMFLETDEQFFGENLVNAVLNSSERNITRVLEQHCCDQFSGYKVLFAGVFELLI